MSAVAAAECSSCGGDKGRERTGRRPRPRLCGEGRVEAEEEELVEDSNFNAYCKACIHPGRATPDGRDGGKEGDAAHVYY